MEKKKIEDLKKASLAERDLVQAQLILEQEKGKEISRKNTALKEELSNYEAVLGMLKSNWNARKMELQKKKKYRLRGRSSETAKAHRG
eukprot:TRINITY_DN3736_c0_g1_i1.p2 TRINITY_DN3736_c0_g1~~TRINITY_DN3736_c0_g1_i1.p2  ORF type:complete len:88 (+),score=49.54 TRINITY_DN3736_c0_g1_i1:275-538(+)